MSMSIILNKTIRHILLIMSLGSALLAASPGPMAADKSGQPSIDIHSDNADFNQNNGVSTYTGNVKLIRSGLTLTGSRLVVSRLKNKKNIKAVLTGSPAYIDKKPDADDDKVIKGHSQQIVYTNADSRVTLRGKAKVTRDGDTIRGSVITYNVDTGATRAKRSKDDDQERVHITISPDR